MDNKTDLVKRLRHDAQIAGTVGVPNVVLHEAADTIDQQAEELRNLKHDIARHVSIISEQTTQLAEKDKQLAAAIELLSYANCPNCDGSGFTVRSVLVQVGENPDGSPIGREEAEQEQCQWCHEVEALREYSNG